METKYYVHTEVRNWMKYRIEAEKRGSGVYLSIQAEPSREYRSAPAVRTNGIDTLERVTEDIFGKPMSLDELIDIAREVSGAFLDKDKVYVSTIDFPLDSDTKAMAVLGALSGIAAAMSYADGYLPLATLCAVGSALGLTPISIYTAEKISSKRLRERLEETLPPVKEGVDVFFSKYRNSYHLSFTK